jgi:hypothetical protein
VHDLPDSAARLHRWAQQAEPPTLDALAQRSRTRRLRRRIAAAATCTALLCIAGVTIGLLASHGHNPGTTNVATGPTTTNTTTPPTTNSGPGRPTGGTMAVVPVAGTVQGRTDRCIQPVPSFYRTIRKHGPYDKRVLCTTITLGSKGSCVTVGLLYGYRHPRPPFDLYYYVVGKPSPSDACR